MIYAVVIMGIALVALIVWVGFLHYRMSLQSETISTLLKAFQVQERYNEQVDRDIGRMEDRNTGQL